MNPEAAALIARLQLRPHPEGGWFRETWRSAQSVEAPGRGVRAAGTSIYFLLAAGAVSRLHRLAADEVWHHHSGGAVVLHIFAGDGYRAELLGDPREPSPRWQSVVPAGAGFGAEVAEPNGWALLGCTLAPGYEPADFAWVDAGELRRRHPEAAHVIERLGRN